MPDTTPAQHPTEISFWPARLESLLQQADKPLSEHQGENISLRQLNALWSRVEQSDLPANTAFTLYRHGYSSELLALKLYLQIQQSAEDALQCLLQNTAFISNLLKINIGSEQRGMISLAVEIDDRACLLHRQAIFGFLCDLLNQLGPQPGQLVSDASVPLGAMSLLDIERDTGFNLQPSNQIVFRLPVNQLREHQQHRHSALRTHIGPALKRYKADEFGSQRGLEDVVKQKILQLLPDGTAGLELVAEQLQTSSRHLRRKLAEAGTSFEKLFDSTRKRQADYLMRDTALSLTEIAYELGFNDPSSLTRACKRWFDCNPSNYREQQHAHCTD